MCGYAYKSSCVQRLEASDIPGAGVIHSSHECQNWIQSFAKAVCTLRVCVISTSPNPGYLTQKIVCTCVSGPARPKWEERTLSESSEEKNPNGTVIIKLLKPHAEAHVSWELSSESWVQAVTDATSKTKMNGLNNLISPCLCPSILSWVPPNSQNYL